MAHAPKMALEQQPVREVFFTRSSEAGGRQRVKVTPPTIHVGGRIPAKKIRWINKTESPVHVWLPSVKGFLASRRNLLSPVRIDPGKPLEVGVRAAATKGKWEYDYHVFCEGIGDFGDFAVGNSPPTVSCP
jgi:hypothetical protein